MLLSTTLDELRPWLVKPLRSPALALALVEGPRPRTTLRHLGLPSRCGTHSARDFAVLLLKAGAEVEHSLLVQYLYAAYSINDKDQQDAQNEVLGWKATLRLIAREEMAHLITVQNLLLSLDEPAHLNRAHLHIPARLKPLPFVLEPLSLTSLAKYVILESPSDDQFDSHTREVVEQVQSILDHQHQAGLLRVGLIYATLYWLFLEGDEPASDWPFPCDWVGEFQAKYGGLHLDNGDFITKEEYEERAASRAEWGIFETNAHADGAEPREVALSAIRWIMAQGEGPNAIEKSHFYRFVELFCQFRDKGRAVNQLIFNVPTNPVAHRGPVSSGATRISDPHSLPLAALLNIRYQLLLLDTAECLARSRKTDPAGRQRYAEWSVQEMEFVKNIAQILPHRPLGSKITGKSGVAAAPFETIALPSAPAQQKKLRTTLIEESGLIIDKFADTLSPKSKNPFVAREPSLLQEISTFDDEMRRHIA